MRKIVLFTMLVSTLLTYGQSSLKGVITGSDNEPIAYANIYLKSTSIGGTSDETGQYQINNIPYGEYTVVVSLVGYKTSERKVNFNDTQTIMNFQLFPQAETLEEVELFGERRKRADKLDVLTRLPLNPNEQIQSISVLSHRLIEQQEAQNISDVTKNVAGVYTFATYGNTKESMSLRGYRGIPILKNGVRVHSDFRGQGIITDMSGVDNIQVLKGVSAISQGLGTDLGSAGGVINIVTKTPKFVSGGQVSLLAGSYGKVRPTFDFYGPVNKSKTLAFRIAGAYDRADSYRAVVNSNRFYINPSLAYKPSENTEIILEMDYMDDSRVPDPGTINLGDYSTNDIYNLPNDKFLGFKSDISNTKNMTYAIRLNHDLTDKLSLRAGFFSSGLNIYNENVSLTNGGGRSKLPQLTPKEERYRLYRVGKREDYNNVLQFDFTGKDVFTGSLKHTFQVGVDYRTNNFSNSSFDVTYPGGEKYIDIINVKGKVSNTLPDGVKVVENRDKETGADVKAIGFTIQDKISLTSWADIFLGLRYSSMERTKGDVVGRSLTGGVRNNVLNPLVGFNIKPIENIIIFGSYASTSDPRSAFNTDKDGNELGEERWDQYEAGIKSTWFDNALRANLTLYNTFSKNMNLPVLDEAGNSLGYYQKGGEDDRKGLELEIIGHILPNLELIAGYSYLDAKYKNHTSYFYNSRPFNSPKHTANFYARYNFRDKLEGLSIGAGVYYLGSRPFNVWSRNYTHVGVVPGKKPFDLKAYTTMKAQIAYRFNEHFTLSVFGNNLTNALGYNAYRDVYINRIQPINFGTNLRYTF